MSSIVGAITGGILGLYKDYQDKRAADRQEALALEQKKQARLEFELEQQARRKNEQNLPDIEALMKKNQSGPGATNLTGSRGTSTASKNLGGGSSLLGS